MTYLLKHIIEYHEQIKNNTKVREFSGNEIALLNALTDEPTSSMELAKTAGVARETVQRIIRRLNEKHGGIEVQSFGNLAPTLYWKSENFDSIYDEI